MYQAQERLYLTRDGRIVKEGDPEAYSLFVAAGGYVPFQLAARYGLTAPSAQPKPETQSEQDASAPDQEHKARSAPPKTKHRAGPPRTK